MWKHLKRRLPLVWNLKLEEQAAVNALNRSRGALEKESRTALKLNVNFEKMRQIREKFRPEQRALQQKVGETRDRRLYFEAQQWLVSVPYPPVEEAEPGADFTHFWQKNDQRTGQFAGWELREGARLKISAEIGRPFLCKVKSATMNSHSRMPATIWSVIWPLCSTRSTRRALR